VPAWYQTSRRKKGWQIGYDDLPARQPVQTGPRMVLKLSHGRSR
jgi:hypothetical protein